MARTFKKGLDYFPLDIDIFNDLKIRKLIKYQGGKAITVYALLLCNIYKSGYYMKWDKELPFICSELTGFEEAYISEVIKTCLTLGLFSKELFDAEKVLTSKGIQERYSRICVQCRRVCYIGDYNLIEKRKPKQTEKLPRKNDNPQTIQGSTTVQNVDYPDMALPACDAVVSGQCSKALLFCGTGVGISMAANKVKGIRACCCSDSFSCEYTRRHNDANALCMGGRVVGAGLACQLVDIFLNTEFEGGRHQRRIDKLTALENR